jgi:hypothetical protein
VWFNAKTRGTVQLFVLLLIFVFFRLLLYKPVNREYIIDGDVASDKIFDNDDHHQEQ